MRLPRIVVMLAMATVGAVGIWWALIPEKLSSLPLLAGFSGHCASFENTADIERELKTLRAELKLLRRQQEGLSRSVDSVGVLAAETARKAEMASFGSVPPSPAEQAEAEAKQSAERLVRQEALYGQLEEASYAEERDLVWAGRTEALISDAVRSASVGSRLIRAECRSSFCRIELVHEGPEARSRTLEGLITTRSLKGEFVVRRIQDEGGLVSRIYMAREGMRLPPFRQ